jgi:hypothetical protein
MTSFSLFYFTIFLINYHYNKYLWLFHYFFCHTLKIMTISTECNSYGDVTIKVAQYILGLEIKKIRNKEWNTFLTM